MIVLKFGGTSVGDGVRIGRVADLVASRRVERPLVVVSAMGGITDLLVALKGASKGKDRSAAEAALLGLADRHRAALDLLALPETDARACDAALERELNRARELSLGISLLEEISPRTSDG
ncbi:MAG TPA: lysine-sensitive aspartokinase 3, partial [Thermoanaerobaculia bacterium]|nr:lysine-sensitive aspartokinase 3 [Thermoanaerobaculia bacterium]